MKKLTYEFIKSEFEKEGYTLVSKEYINSKTKLDYKCSKGHEHSIRLNAWQRGHRCSTCARVIKPTLELVKQSFEKDDYILLSKEYINNNTKLDYKCPKNHEYSITWRNWKQGNRCLICAGRITSTMEQVKKSFENEGYTLISKEYKSSKTKLYYICSNGHERSTTWNIWKNGHRCIICSGKMKLTLEYIKESFTESGYILLSKIYKNSKSKLNYRCSKGHEHSISWNSWIKGHRCLTCSGKIRHTIDKIKAAFENEGYTLLTKEYLNSDTRLYYKCSRGHGHSIVYRSWISGNRCPICANINNSGSNNPAWKGGTSYEPYCPIWQDKGYKNDIKLRDGNKCLNPSCYKKDKILSIHHIDYNKKNCSPYNLITVCRSCNSRANTDREWHTAWYNALIYKRYLENKHAN